MSNSHGDLFTEIGKLVLAANSGQSIDLNATVSDLADRYRNLGMTEETLMKVVTRSIGAISYSMARTNSGLQERLEALRETGGVPLKERSGLFGTAKPANGASLVSEPIMADASEATADESPAEPTPVAAVTKPTSGRRSRRTSAKSSPDSAKTQTPFPSGVRLAVIP